MATRILIADDHPFVRRSLRTLLEGSAHDWEVCGEAENGQEAVAKAQNLCPDLIILDWVMPGGDGLQAAREILKTQPSVRIVMHTLHNGREIENEARKVGVQHVVSKTHGGSALIREIETLLQEGLPLEQAAPAQKSTPRVPEPGAPGTRDGESDPPLKCGGKEQS